MSLHWSSISSIWRLVGALSTSTANGLLSSSNLLFWASKSANRPVISVLSMPSFSPNCTWEHGGKDLHFYGLAARKMAEVSLQHLSLPQAQFCLKISHFSIRVCDDMAPPLKRFSTPRWLMMLQRNASSYRNFFIPELCCVFPFAC